MVISVHRSSKPLEALSTHFCGSSNIRRALPQMFLRHLMRGVHWSSSSKCVITTKAASLSLRIWIASASIRSTYMVSCPCPIKMALSLMRKLGPSIWCKPIIAVWGRLWNVRPKLWSVVFTPNHSGYSTLRSMGALVWERGLLWPMFPRSVLDKHHSSSLSRSRCKKLSLSTVNLPACWY